MFLMCGVNWAMILAIKSSLVEGFGAGWGLTATGFGFSTTGALRMAMKLGSDVLVSWYPFSSAVYLTVIKDPRGST